MTSLPNPTIKQLHELNAAYGVTESAWLSNNPIPMNVKPHGDRVLVELLPDEKPDAKSIIIAPTADREAHQKTERGIVRGIGGKCTLPIVIGDEVQVFTNHGMELPHTTARLFFSQHVIAKKE